MRKDSKELVDYFISSTNERFTRLEDQNAKIIEKVDDLSSFRWRIIGGAGVVAILASAFFTILMKG